MYCMKGWFNLPNEQRELLEEMFLLMSMILHVANRSLNSCILLLYVSMYTSGSQTVSRGSQGIRGFLPGEPWTIKVFHFFFFFHNFISSRWCQYLTICIRHYVLCEWQFWHQTACCQVNWYAIKMFSRTSSAVSESRDYFSRKLKELYQQRVEKSTFYKQASIPSNALLAS